MANVVICSECEGQMEVNLLSPLKRVACPHCGVEVRVKADSKLILAGGVLLLALLGLGVFALKGRGSEKDVAKNGGGSSHYQLIEGDDGSEKEQSINRLYNRVRKAIESGKLEEAELNLIKICRMYEVPDEAAAWACFEAGLAALLDGRSSDASSAFTRLESHLDRKKLDAEVKGLLMGFIEDWDRLEPYRVQETCPKDEGEALVEFVKALKNWEQGERDAFVYFEAFGEYRFTKKKDWVSGYQAWSRKLASDARALAEAEPDWDEDYTERESANILESLSELEENLETKGRARFIVESWKEWVQGKLQGGEAIDWEEKARAKK